MLIVRNHIWSDLQKRGRADTGDLAKTRLLTCQSTHTFTDPPPGRNKTPKITSIRMYNGRMTGIFLVQCSVCSYATAFLLKIISQLFYNMKFETFRDGLRLCMDDKLGAIIRGFISTGIVVNPRTKI